MRLKGIERGLFHACALSHVLVLAAGIEPASRAWQARIVAVRPRQYGANRGIRTHYLVLTKDAHIRMCLEGMEPPHGFEP